MRVISLHHPWAFLVAVQEKSVESRSWETDYRGPIAIHAAKRWDKETAELCETEPFQSCLFKHGVTHPDMQLPFGCIVAVVNLVECRSTDGLFAAEWIEELSEQERAFGNYSPGRFGWFLRDAMRLAEPIQTRGFQKIWNADIPGLESAYHTWRRSVAA